MSDARVEKGSLRLSDCGADDLQMPPPEIPLRIMNFVCSSWFGLIVLRAPSVMFHGGGGDAGNTGSDS